RAPRPEPLSNGLRELARLQAKAQGSEGLEQALAYLATAARVAEEARAAAFEPQGRSLETALAYEYGRVYTYAGQYEDALASLEEAAALLGEPGADGNNDEDRAGEWTECVRLSAVVEGFYLERRSAALARLDKAISLLASQGHSDLQEQLSSLAAQLREEE
ncbi:hypothetical protein G3I28_11310, partial [Streptomyces sp. SID10116]|nr:hypothetical protein [Streptomyces sp. SID10116]